MFWKNDPWWKKKITYWDNPPISQFEWEKVHQYFLDMIPQQSIGYPRCLDVGTGSGLVTKRIKEKGYEVIGIECDARAITLASAKGLKVLKIDVEKDKFPFENQYFDVITCFEVIEHLREPSNMLTEVHRILKNDGCFIISTPNVSWWYLRLKLLFGIWGLPEPDHIRFFTPKSLKECLNFFGFKVVKINSFFYFPRITFLRLPCFHSISYGFTFLSVKILD